MLHHEVAPAVKHEPAPSWQLPAVTALTAVALFVRWKNFASWNFVDLVVFYYSGVSTLEGTSLYAARPGVLAFNYPPFAGLVFTSLATAGLAASKVLLTLATVTAYVTTLIATRCGSSLSWRSVLLIGCAGLALEPLVRVLVLGQLGVILMGMVLADCFLVPPRYRGILVGLAAGIKLVPAIFVLYFMLGRDWGAVARTVGVALATVAIALVVAPESSRLYWLEFVGRTDRIGTYADRQINQSLHSLVTSVWPWQYAEAVAWFVAVIMLGLGVLAAYLCLSAGQNLASVLCLAGTSLLVSPISWTHHWVWVVPLLGLLIGMRRVQVATLTLLLFFVSPMWLVNLADGTSPLEVLAGYAYVVAAGAALILTVRSRVRTVVGPEG